MATTVEPAAERDEAPPRRLAVLARWLRGVLRREDPGAQRAVLGLRALNAFALAGMGGLLIERGYGGHEAVIMPPFAAVVALHAVMFETGSNRGEATRQIAVLIGTATASLITATLLRPAAMILPFPGPEALLIPASFLTMYLRRHGPLGQSAGVVLFIAAIYAVSFGPTYASLPWEALAGLIGVGGALAIRLCSGAPETDVALLAQARGLREQVAFLLRSCRLALHAARRDDLERAAGRRGVVRTAWGEFRGAVESGLGPNHPSQPRLQRAVARLYVLQQAAISTAESLAVLAPSLRRLGMRDRALISRALGRLERLALAGPEPAPALTSAAASAQAELRKAAAERTELDPLSRFALVRVAFALARVQRSIEEPPELAESTAAAPLADEDGLSPTTRMAWQAAAAATALVILDGLLSLEHGYWGVLTGVLIVANSFADTWRRAVERALGTILGVAAALAIGPLTGNAPAVMLPAAAIAIVAAVATLKSRYAASQAGAAFAVVIALEVFLDSPLSVLVSRIWETALGGVAGMLASALVLPLRLTGEFTVTARALFARAREETAAALAAAKVGQGRGDAPPGSALLAAWAAQKARYRNLAAEALFGGSHRIARPFLVAQLDLVIEQVALIEDAVGGIRDGTSERLAAAIAELAARADTAFDVVLARLDGLPGPAFPATDDLPALIAHALPFEDLTPGAEPAAFEARAQVSYHARKLIQVLADVADDLGRPDAPRAPTGRIEL